MKTGFRSRVIWDQALVQKWAEQARFKMHGTELRQVQTEKTREHLGANFVLFGIMGRACFGACQGLCSWLASPSAASTFHG